MNVEVSISVRTLLVAAGIVAVAGALASIGSALLMILVSVLGVAVLSPVATAMERRLGWSRALCSTVLVLGIVIALAVVLLVLAQAVSDAVRGFSHDLPEIVDHVRHSDVGDFINGGSGSLDTLREHATDITKGVATVSGGVADVGVSAFGAVTLFFSVIFLTLFGLNDEPRVRDWIGGLMYRDTRERYLDVTDRIIHATSRYMLGNLAISVICATVYGVTAVILDLPYPLALALIAGFLDLIPTVGATIAGRHHLGRRAVGRPRGAGRLRDRDGWSTSRSRTTFCSRRSSGGRPACRASPCSSACWRSERCSAS